MIIFQRSPIKSILDTYQDTLFTLNKLSKIFRILRHRDVYVAVCEEHCKEFLERSITKVNKVKKHSYCVLSAKGQTLYVIYGIYNIMDCVTRIAYEHLDSKKYDPLLLDLSRNLSFRTSRNLVIKYVDKLFQVGDREYRLNCRFSLSILLKNNILLDLEKNLKQEVKKLKIWTTRSNEFLAVQPIGQKYHPNVDEDGFYCLGRLKKVKLTDMGLDLLISNIKILCMDDRYSQFCEDLPYSKLEQKLLLL